ncbi:hypothetical protein [Enterocloster sp.]|uniref:hypothetical protein n=1 Tax=Enterocloster sp. TaxID=2719315 RepID=UPI0039A216C8
MIDIRTESKGYVAHGVKRLRGLRDGTDHPQCTDVLGQDTTLVIPPGCSALFCGFGCETGIVSAFQGNLENSAAIATGIRAGYAVQEMTIPMWWHLRRRSDRHRAPVPCPV